MQVAVSRSSALPRSSLGRSQSLRRSSAGPPTGALMLGSGLRDVSEQVAVWGLRQLLLRHEPHRIDEQVEALPVDVGDKLCSCGG